MKHFLFTLIAIASIFSLHAQTRNLDAFQEVEVSGSIKAELVASNNPKVDIKILNGDIDDLKTTVKNGTLSIKFKKGFMDWSKKRAEVTIYYTDLKGIDVSSGTSLTSRESIETDLLDVDASSGSAISISVATTSLSLEASSGAAIKAEGSSKDISLEASSGSSIHAKSVIADHGRAQASSGASVLLTANKSIKAEASSGGSVEYAGNPEKENIKSKRSSGGSVSKI